VNRSVFIQLLQHPQLATKEQENDLRAMVHTYPYFQSAQILLAKNLHNQNSYLYEKQLKTAALYAGSRKLLYQFILQPEIKKQELVSALDAKSATNKVTEVSIEELQELAHKHIFNEKELLPASVPQTAITLIETPPEEITLIPESITIESTTNEQPVVINANEPHSFDEWLNLISGKYIIDVADPFNADEELAADTRVIQAEKQTEKETTTTLVEDLVNKNKAFDSDSIIEKFIKESPSISRPKAEFFNPANMAKISIEEDDDLATETLAKIYTKQGNYKKAIRIYEKLCLKFPDKMPYFVALIQKIKSDNKID
jgi:tetratricopeptide (TPR) repeat protein